MGLCGSNNLHKNRKEKNDKKKSKNKIISKDINNKKGLCLNTNNGQNNEEINNINYNENNQKSLSEDELEDCKNFDTELLVADKKILNPNQKNINKGLNDNQNNNTNKSETDAPNIEQNNIPQNNDISIEKDKILNNTPYKLQASVNSINNEDDRDNKSDYKKNYLFDSKYPNSNGNKQYLNNIQK